MNPSADFFRDFHLFFVYPDIAVGVVFIPAFLEYHLISPIAFPEIFLKPVMFERQDFQRHLFSLLEFETLNDFKNLKRQLQWLAGRFAVKQLVKRLIAPARDAHTIEIEYEPMGAPFLSSMPHIPISIAHSGEFAVAAMGLNDVFRVGVDIEKIHMIDMEGVLEIAFSLREQSVLQGSLQSEFYRSWTLKEAFLKLIRKGFFEEVKSVEILGNQIFYAGRVMDRAQIFSRPIGSRYIFSLVYTTVHSKIPLSASILRN